MFAEILIYGTIQACIYALLAMGFTLVYGVGRVLNLAHGAFYLLAGYVLFWYHKTIGLTGAAILALVVISIVGAVSYILLIKPLQDHEISVVLVTFALGFLTEQFIRVFFDVRPHTIKRLIPGSVTFLGVTFDAQSLITIFGSLIVVLLVGLFIKKSKVGKSIQAVSQDREAAMLTGINANRMLMYTVTLSALLAGVSAILYLPSASIAPHMGWDILTNAFAVVILGGLGSVKGSLLASFILGYVKNFVIYAILPSLSAVVPIAIIIIVLLIRPQGLFGKKEVE
ncbi:MAG: branched-chain amino acid ABC transporter permease [Promethearchaeota archaeon]|nr:MAG: branched-chain amino acid ABC transporter permease [Candidatus Lokiarchaeota archaeon]